MKKLLLVLTLLVLCFSTVFAATVTVERSRDKIETDLTLSPSKRIVNTQEIEARKLAKEAAKQAEIDAKNAAKIAAAEAATAQKLAEKNQKLEAKQLAKKSKQTSQTAEEDFEKEQAINLGLQFRYPVNYNDGYGEKQFGFNLSYEYRYLVDALAKIEVAGLYSYEDENSDINKNLALSILPYVWCINDRENDSNWYYLFGIGAEAMTIDISNERVHKYGLMFEGAVRYLFSDSWGITADFAFHKFYDYQDKAPVSGGISATYKW